MASCSNTIATVLLCNWSGNGIAIISAQKNNRTFGGSGNI
jgi:hypothetical protein